jgi:hypothetical protein
MWPAGAPNPFVWSYDGSSYGTHADYLFGWKGDSLQRAMNKSECFYDGCGSIKKQPMATANNCKVQNMVGEDTGGCECQHFPKGTKADAFQGLAACLANDDFSHSFCHIWLPFVKLKCHPRISCLVDRYQT